MLKNLNLKNLVLVESSEIEFRSGLTIISGETGAGKTALIEAIGLALGERADSSYIRKGADKAFVEAIFDISGNEECRLLLEEAGIDLEKEEFLSIRREIAREGKNRAFINCRLAPLPLIQKIGKSLIDLIGQHSYHDLRTAESHRDLLDRYGEAGEALRAFQQTWQEEKKLKGALEELEGQAQKRERELDICRAESEELEAANLKENEEEALFEEYNRLSHSQELSEKIGGVYNSLSEAPGALLPALNRLRNALEGALRIDPTLKPSSELLSEASIALKEASSSLSSYLGALDIDPRRFSFLEERLTLLNRLKRKYGDILAYRKEVKEKLSRLENIDEEIEKAREALKKSEKNSAELVHLLREKRKGAAATFEAALTASLRALNMSSAELNINMSPQTRSHAGEDFVEFWLAANKGEAAVPVRESSSGGELSRLLLAIKTTLAEKNRTPTLIFDEIDANVGGETAAVIGETLHALGASRQVLCITHFPQVASKGDHHLRVRKEESDGRTLASVEVLKKKEREQELLRMLGGDKKVFSIKG